MMGRVIPIKKVASLNQQPPTKDDVLPFFNLNLEFQDE
jgi:hypothetical protein